ncbi:MAG TPA: NAD-dependent epimerase/dehydratase family protein [Thermoleophilaceae bacterium]|nr:NAD-dependent epimerase/dehydratase family protein [Thermoleophilaceae bacterium]
MRYVVTGGSGYIGTRLVQRLAESEDTERIMICDIREPRVRARDKVAYERLDVRDGARARQILERERPDALVHLAFVLDPIHDENAMYEVDVNGTSNILEAAEAAGVEQGLVTSSATAYGAFPDNPIPIAEDRPVRGVPDFEYARDKAESDRICQLWAWRNRERVMTIVRPTVVFGPTVNNFIIRLLTSQPFVADLGGEPSPIQFVHEDDLVDALEGLLRGRHAGAFNVAADGTMTLRECAEAIGLPVRRVPRALYWRLVALLWRLRVSEAPPGYLHFVVNPWVVSNARLKEANGWSPRHTTRETFELTMREQGLLGAGGSS